MLSLFIWKHGVSDITSLALTYRHPIGNQSMTSGAYPPQRPQCQFTQSKGWKRQGGGRGECSYMGLLDMSRNFWQRQSRKMQSRGTWWIPRDGRHISLQPDCFLPREGNIRDFREVTSRAPLPCAVVVTIHAGSARRLAGYKKQRSRFPVRLQQKATHTHVEQIFKQLKDTCKPPPKRERPANVWIQPAT